MGSRKLSKELEIHISLSVFYSVVLFSLFSYRSLCLLISFYGLPYLLVSSLCLFAISQAWSPFCRMRILSSIIKIIFSPQLLQIQIQVQILFPSRFLFLFLASFYISQIRSRPSVLCKFIPNQIKKVHQKVDNLVNQTVDSKTCDPPFSHRSLSVA